MKGPAVSTSLRERIGSTRIVWVLVDAAGGTRVAAPQTFDWSALSLDSSRWEHSLEEVLPAVLAFLKGHPDWAVLVSVLRGGEGHQLVQEYLPPAIARELQEREHEDLRELGMDLPLGEWAQPSEAAIYFVEATGP